MIIVRSTDGLGNQLFQYAIGRRLSLLYNTDLLIDNSHFINFKHRKFLLDCFNTHFSEVNNYKKLALKRSLAMLRLKMGYFSKVQEEPGFPVDMSSFSKNSFLTGYWQNEIYFKNIREVLLTEITIRDTCESDLFSYYKKLISNSNSISIHIRRGDFSDPKNRNIFELLDMEYYQKAIELMASKVVNPIFYIFSDDIDWAKNNLSNLKDSFFIEPSYKLKDFEELILMSNCKHNIIANSTFSWWAAWLNDQSHKIVLQPKLSYRDTGLQKAYELNNILYSENFFRL